jgi:hypothetical protein
MRLFAAILLSIALATVASAEELTFPYKAYVTSNEVYVRSGPGKNYYPTSKLASGTEVEVYRHDPGGWYAVRPPEGSFAWVSGRYLQVTSDGLAKVAAEEVAARVGSEFSDIRDVIQVRLHRGEVVEVLDKKQFGSGADAGTWYKIAPPSGEFRWVSGKFVDPDFPRDGLRKSSAENNPLLHPTPPAGSTASKAPATSPTPVQAAAPAAEAWGPSKVVPSVAGPLGSTVRRDEPPRAGGPRQFHDPDDPRVANKPTRQLSPEEFQDELDKLEMGLSVMVVEEPTVWNFDEVAVRAKTLLLEAETAVERGRARTLLNKIAQSEDIKQRYDTVAKLRTTTERENHQLAELSQARGGVRSAEAASGSDRYDGTGRLARVVSPKVGAPQYALVDDGGNVQCYVSPAPGVNMQAYVGQRIGVVGIRGYITEQRAQHVMAKHVTSLDASRSTTLR